LVLKRRYLRGLKGGGGVSDGEHPEYARPVSATSVSPKPAANDVSATEQAVQQSSKSWPFSYALGLALLAGAVLWGFIAALLHYL
jgi:hypothetical protein